MKTTNEHNHLVYQIDVGDSRFSYTSSIETALSHARSELLIVDETLESLKLLKPECDKLDYALAASSGALCGIIDIFLVGKPGESPLGNITDKWFADRTKDFATLCHPDGKIFESHESALRFLEKRFKIPYDQTGVGDTGKKVFGLSPSNHHFKSLGHNPSLLGLFFSILDQFENSSHFITDGQLISLQKADEKWVLHGKNIPSKLFCGFVNWFGHLVSDVSGSQSSARNGTRGMGIPSPLWTWTNDIIAIRSKLNLPVSEINKTINQLALEIFEKGYDTRFQTAQAIPVFLNEILVRLIYSVRTMNKYFAETNGENRSFTALWKQCEPFSDPTVKRMLTVAHGTFCVIDVGEAAVRSFIAGGGSFDPVEFLLRLNIVGLGRFTISLYGEIRRESKNHEIEHEVLFMQKQRSVIMYYVEGLVTLSALYDDKDLVNFVEDLKRGNMYVQAFQKSVKLAEMRKVPAAESVETKADIDAYFTRGK